MAVAGVLIPRIGNEAIYQQRAQPLVIPSYDKAEMVAMMSYVCDNLGEATSQRWFEEYPERYSVARLRALSKHLAPGTSPEAAAADR
ncbi:hypothetical protein Hoch_1580 [Haliangium ochraceum DSM 14365]|uniref:Uncharacterized protein n=1 Tax=Haliangium ochraceum (strain DSM 14365 / JCM 11303 / SMP-2) TaxID=502025 RepID=D0LVZ7_HALO1|nr:hypothetical protein Hoch_1580 [Haliangium ochraceum DSM 14365]